MRDLTTQPAVRDLTALQSLPLDTKILWAYARIAEALEWCDDRGLTPLISLSGGKDSWVLMTLVRHIRPSVQAVFVNTGLEYPDVTEHARSASNVIELRPDMSFRQVLDKHGYPVVSKIVSRNISRIRNTRSLEQIDLRMHGGINPTSGKVQHQSLADKWKYLLAAPFDISDACCDVMKKRPLNKYHKSVRGMPFIGTLASDSDIRKQSWRQNGCNVYDTAHGSSRPLSIWTEQDILRYICQEGLIIAPVYGSIVEDSNGCLGCTGEDRTGCIFCLFGIFMEQKKRGSNRFQRMYITHPQLWEYCMDKLGIREVMAFLGLPILPERPQ